MKPGLYISQLSRQANVPVPTIRYYERLGLLDPPQRTQSQYRIYSTEAKERLQFIQQAKQFGLSLEEIKQILDLSVSGITPCHRVKNLLKQHLDEVDRRIQEMIAFRQELTHRYQQLNDLLSETSGAAAPAMPDGKVCGFIEQAIDSKVQ